MPTVNANGIDIYYERRGEGPRLLFLNGSGATLERIVIALAGPSCCTPVSTRP